MKFKGTKGNIFLRKMNSEYHIHNGLDIIAATNPTYFRKNNWVISKTNEEEHNAKLIADAFTTINKCDLLPSELLEQRNELLDALKELHKLLEDNKHDARWYLQKHHNKAYKAITKTETI